MKSEDAPLPARTVALVTDVGIGLGIALLIVTLLLFAGAEDQGFIYVDF